ncbi:MAG: citrate synthase, partial [Clostridia bacterium]|nr:citrate synthase [Clostridia bacterium]
MKNYYSEITPYIWQLSDLSNKNYNIKAESYSEHNVKRGLRDIDGKGVVTGLTEISDVTSRKILPDGTEIPCEGELRYRGINIHDLVNGFMKDNRFGFEETIYLLLFSELPTDGELARFKELLGDYRRLPASFVRDMILKAPGKDLMNILSRCVLALYP